MAVKLPISNIKHKIAYTGLPLKPIYAYDDEKDEVIIWTPEAEVIVVKRSDVQDKSVQSKDAK